MIRTPRPAAALLLCLLPLGALAAAPATPPAPEPVLLGRAALGGTVFSDPRTVVTQESSEAGKSEARDLVAHESADRCLQTGVYEIGPNRFTVAEPYPHDEFMYFVSGGVTLRSSGGAVTEVSAGDGVLLPKGWTGVWDSQGYRKIYVIHSCQPT